MASDLINKEMGLKGKQMGNIEEVYAELWKKNPGWSWIWCSRFQQNDTGNGEKEYAKKKMK